MNYITFEKELIKEFDDYLQFNNVDKKSNIDAAIS